MLLHMVLLLAELLAGLRNINIRDARSMPWNHNRTKDNPRQNGLLTWKPRGNR